MVYAGHNDDSNSDYKFDAVRVALFGVVCEVMFICEFMFEFICEYVLIISFS